MHLRESPESLCLRQDSKVKVPLNQVERREVKLPGPPPKLTIPPAAAEECSAE